MIIRLKISWWRSRSRRSREKSAKILMMSSKFYLLFLVFVTFSCKGKASFTSSPPSKTYFKPPENVTLSWILAPSTNPVVIIFSKFNPARRAYDEILNYIVPTRKLIVFRPDQRKRMDMKGIAVFRINNTNAADAGTYKCKVNNNNGQFESSTELIVGEIPSNGNGSSLLSLSHSKTITNFPSMDDKMAATQTQEIRQVKSNFDERTILTGSVDCPTVSLFVEKRVPTMLTSLTISDTLSIGNSLPSTNSLNTAIFDGYVSEYSSRYTAFAASSSFTFLKSSVYSVRKPVSITHHMDSNRNKVETSLVMASFNKLKTINRAMNSLVIASTLSSYHQYETRASLVSITHMITYRRSEATFSASSTSQVKAIRSHEIHNSKGNSSPAASFSFNEREVNTNRNISKTLAFSHSQQPSVLKILQTKNESSTTTATIKSTNSDATAVTAMLQTIKGIKTFATTPMATATILAGSFSRTTSTTISNKTNQSKEAEQRGRTDGRKTLALALGIPFVLLISCMLIIAILKIRQRDSKVFFSFGDILKSKPNNKVERTNNTIKLKSIRVLDT